MEFELDDKKTDEKKNGTLYFKRSVVKTLSFKAEIIGTEKRFDRAGNQYSVAFLEVEGEEKTSRWNCFDMEQGKKIKPGNFFFCTGTIFGPYKKQLLKVEEI